jgi:hypothetical protein
MSSELSRRHAMIFGYAKAIDAICVGCHLPTTELLLIKLRCLNALLTFLHENGLCLMVSSLEECAYPHTSSWTPIGFLRC